MKKQNIMYLTVFLIILIFGAICSFFQNKYVPQNKYVSNEDLEADKNNIIPINVSSEILTLKPGESKILSDDLRIIFGRSGTEFSVPDIIFGEHYNLNNPQNINYLPIYNIITLYDRGKVISLQKKECNTKDVFTDIPERHIVDCKLKINIEYSTTPKISKNKIEKTIKGSSDSRSIYHPSYVIAVQGELVSKDPLLYVGIPDFYLRDWRNYPAGTIIGGPFGRSGSEGYNFGFPIITNFGIAEIVYTPSELFDEVRKKIQIGPAVISITPQKNVIKSEIMNNDFSFHISMEFKEDPENYSVKILYFTY